MPNIDDIEVLSFEGKAPSEDVLMNVIEKKNDEGLQLEDMKTQSFYLGQTGIEKHVVTMLFAEDELSTFVQDTDEITQELEDELDDELL